MADESAFIEQIAQHMDDPGPKLIFADWLEEQGDPEASERAEFIRTQLALEQIPPGVKTYEKLKIREQLLITDHWRQWVRPACQALNEPVPMNYDNQSRERGGRYSCALYKPTNTMRIIQSSPLTERFDIPSDNQGRLLQQPESYPFFLGGSFWAGFLANVCLVYRQTKNHMHINRLFERLPIRGLSLLMFPEHAFHDLVKRAKWRSLRHLELTFCQVHDLTDFLNTEHHRLHSLILRNCPLSSYDTLRSPNLKHLTIALKRLTEIEIANLVNSAPWAQLTRVVFTDCTFLGYSATLRAGLERNAQVTLQFNHCNLNQRWQNAFSNHKDRITINQSSGMRIDPRELEYPELLSKSGG